MPGKPYEKRRDVRRGALAPLLFLPPSLNPQGKGVRGIGLPHKIKTQTPRGRAGGGEKTKKGHF